VLGIALSSREPAPR
jgi:hypothetical protein